MAVSDRAYWLVALDVGEDPLAAAVGLGLFLFFLLLLGLAPTEALEAGEVAAGGGVAAPGTSRITFSPSATPAMTWTVATFIKPTLMARTWMSPAGASTRTV
jgi:hypothetical protein